MEYMEFDSSNGSKDGRVAAATPVSQNQHVPWTAYVILASTVLGLSSIGPLLSFQDEGGVIFKILWRSSAFALALIPFVTASLVKDGVPSLPWKCIVSLVLAGLSYGALAILFSWSLYYTTVGDAVIFANTQSIILLIGGGLAGQKISKVE